MVAFDPIDVPADAPLVVNCSSRSFLVSDTHSVSLDAA